MFRSWLSPSRTARRRPLSLRLLHLERLEPRCLPAPLNPGNPVVAGTPQQFTGVGANAATALANFKTAIGGVNNGAVTQPFTSGFRTITWDGVKLDGTDFGGGANTTVISAGNTVGIPLNRFQANGAFFEQVYAVSNNGFVTVNPAATGLFPAFSAPNTFAMFNDNSIDMSFVVPSPATTTPVPAGTRGFGAIFLNVELASKSSIEYFNGDTSLGKFFVPTGTQGQAEFLGVLFNNPIVTRVSLTLGTDVLFTFNGVTFTAGASDNPAMGHNIVVTDDFAYAEPVPIQNAKPIQDGGPTGTLNSIPLFSAVPNTAFSGVVGVFSDAAASPNAKNYTATINWGDGSETNGSIASNGQGGFNVSGTHTYTAAGIFPVTVNVQQFDTAGSSTVVVNTACVGTANQRFLFQTYADLLRRPIDPTGLVFWGSQLDAGASRDTVLQGIESSTEFRTVEVQQLYQHYLGRAADPQGLSAFLSMLSSGGTLEQAASSIVGSTEYFQTKGASTNNGFLAALYQDALGRPIDASGQAFFGAQLTGGASRSSVADQIFASSEYRGHIVDVLYQDFLRRHADASGLSFFSTLYTQGVVNGFDPFSRVITGLLTSLEFNHDVQTQCPILPPVPVDLLKSSLP